MKPKTLYLPVLIVALLLASEMPKVHGLFRVIKGAGRGTANLLRRSADAIDTILINPTTQTPSRVQYTTKLVLPLVIEVEKIEEASPQTDANDKDKEKCNSTPNNKSKSVDKKDTDTTNVKSKSVDNKSSGGKDSSTDTTNNKSKSADNNSSGVKDFSTDTTN